MMVEDLILGWVFSKLFSGRDENRSPAVTFPPGPGSPAPSSPAPAPAPSSPELPAFVPTSPGSPPVFPSQVTPPAAPERAPSQGFKRAVEVWQVQPAIVKQAGPALHGLGLGAEAITIQLLESQFPKGWQGKLSATAEEAANAKRILGQWKDGGVLFLGPATLADRRAYRMTKHPIAASPGAPSAPAPFTPAQVTPAQPPPPAPPPAPPAHRPGDVVTIPEVTITPGPDPGPMVTTVRKGEGLANVAKRLSFPPTAASATAIQKANLPGPDGWYTATPLAKGGLAKKGRAGGLQPGDRLFVPPNWAVDPSAL